MNRVIALLPLLASASASATAVSFDSDIVPLLERHCLDCHSGWFPDAGVDLSSREEIMAGGPSGPLVAPGQPDKGWLMHTINLTSGRLRMPPQGPGLSDDEKDLLRRWIEQGAK